MAATLQGFPFPFTSPSRPVSPRLSQAFTEPAARFRAPRSKRPSLDETAASTRCEESAKEPYQSTIDSAGFYAWLETQPRGKRAAAAGRPDHQAPPAKYLAQRRRVDQDKGAHSLVSAGWRQGRSSVTSSSLPLFLATPKFQPRRLTSITTSPSPAPERTGALLLQEHRRLPQHSAKRVEHRTNSLDGGRDRNHRM